MNLTGNYNSYINSSLYKKADFNQLKKSNNQAVQGQDTGLPKTSISFAGLYPGEKQVKDSFSASESLKPGKKPDPAIIKAALAAIKNIDKNIVNADLTPFAQTGLPLKGEEIDVSKAPQGCKKLFKDLNNLIKAFPEWGQTIGRKQIELHKYTLDVHILMALQEFIKNPEYKELSKSEKNVAKIAIFFHDLEKQKGIKDPSHPENSALKITQILHRTKMPIDVIERITGLIKNHHWLEIVNKSDNKDETYKSIAFEFRRPGDFKIAKMFAKADLKAVGGYADKYIDAIAKYSPEIEEYIRKNHSK